MSEDQPISANQGVSKSNTVLLLIDVINDFDFVEGDELLKRAIPASKRIADLKRRVQQAGLPTIYVNDNFGRWRSDFRSQVDRCLSKDCAGKPIAELLQPTEEDYFVLKPMHSGFYSTVLPVLLERLEARTLILTGFASNICVLFTAHDAHMRNYQVIVPEDCSAAQRDEDHAFAMQQLRSVINADTCASRQLNFKTLNDV